MAATIVRAHTIAAAPMNLMTRSLLLVVAGDNHRQRSRRSPQATCDPGPTSGPLAHRRQARLNMKAFDFIVNLQQERPTAMSSCDAHFEVDPFPPRRFWPVEREID